MYAIQYLKSKYFPVFCENDRSRKFLNSEIIYSIVLTVRVWQVQDIILGLQKFNVSLSYKENTLVIEVFIVAWLLFSFDSEFYLGRIKLP